MAANNPAFPPQPAQPATIPPAPSPLAAAYYPFCDSYTPADKPSEFGFEITGLPAMVSHAEDQSTMIFVRSPRKRYITLATHY